MITKQVGMGAGNMDLQTFLWIIIGAAVVYGTWEWLSEKGRRPY